MSLQVKPIIFKTMQPKTVYESSVFILLRDYLGDPVNDEKYPQRYADMIRRLKVSFPELIQSYENAENLEGKDISGFFYLDEDQDQIFYGSTQEELQSNIDGIQAKKKKR